MAQNVLVLLHDRDPCLRSEETGFVVERHWVVGSLESQRSHCELAEIRRAGCQSLYLGARRVALKIGEHALGPGRIIQVLALRRVSGLQLGVVKEDVGAPEKFHVEPLLRLASQRFLHARQDDYEPVSLVNRFGNDARVVSRLAALDVSDHEPSPRLWLEWVGQSLDDLVRGQIKATQIELGPAPLVPQVLLVVGPVELTLGRAGPRVPSA